MSQPGRPTALASRLAGVLLLLDGAGALAMGALALVLSLFPPVAAIEGRPSPDQSQWGPALGFLALGVVALWAGQRALRGIDPGRHVGAGVALVVAAFLGWWMIQPGGAVQSVAILAALLIVHLLGVVALVHRQTGISRA